jgi:hypothetical protein
MDVATMVGAVKRVKPGLATDEAQGVCSTHGRAEHAATVAVEPARNVQGKHRPGVGIDAFDQGGKIARDRPCEADAEQGIDHQRKVSPWNFGAKVGAGGTASLVGGRRVRRQARGVADKMYTDVPTGAGQFARQDKAVAAVIAGTRRRPVRGRWPKCAWTNSAAARPARSINVGRGSGCVRLRWRAVRRREAGEWA